MNLTEARDALDIIASIDARTKALEQQVASLNREREILIAEIRAAMEADGVQNLVGFRAAAKLTKKEFFSIEPDGWPKLYDRILRTEEFDLLGKVLKQTSVRERFNMGDEVAGVKRTEVTVIDVKPVKQTVGP